MEAINPKDTIAAICTHAGQCAIALIRLSGQDAFAIASAAMPGRPIDTLTPRRATLRTIADSDGETIDSALVTVFHAPDSFTGENTVEIACHGSVWIQEHIMQRLIELGARAALGGEFSQQAFLNGKLDLAEAEGIADLIASTSHAAHRIAINQLKGDFSKAITTLYDRLLHLASMLELELDFSEEDVEFASRSDLLDTAQQTRLAILCMIDSYKTGKAFKEGIRVGIAGVPNAGKSTLLNRIARDEKAIVTDIPGTTRDVIEEAVNIDGFKFLISDTAGLHEASDEVERIGIERALQTISKADLTLWLIDLSQPLETQIKELSDTLKANNTQARIIIVPNKIDSALPHAFEELTDNPELKRLTDSERIKIIPQPISTRNDRNISVIEQLLADHARHMPGADSNVIVSTARHYEALRRGLPPIDRAIEALNAGITPDLIAQDIREVLHELGTITGRITTDAILTNLFRSFCIGK